MVSHGSIFHIIFDPLKCFNGLGTIIDSVSQKNYLIILYNSIHLPWPSKFLFSVTVRLK